jgi:hypothetical protein
MRENIQHQIAAKFPFLFHYGPVTNLEQIERHKAIFSTQIIRTFAGQHNHGTKPPGRELIKTPLGNFTLNDQQALKYGHVKDPSSLSESDFVALLDQFAFFWPGDEDGPIDMGRNFIRRYRESGDLLLQVRVKTESFMKMNHPSRIFLSQCNSGAPRSNPSTLIYRGDNTFISMMNYEGRISDIKEIALSGWAILPSASEIGIFNESLRVPDYARQSPALQ